MAVLFQKVLEDHLEPAYEIQTGDYFKIVVEKIYAGAWMMRYGEIAAFEICRGTKRFTAIRCEDGYYDPTGRSLKAQFLSVPLHYQFISSAFMKSRRHPILGGLRPHHGIDFAAPVGTPVWSIADGEVVVASRLNGFGLTVVVRHAYGYETCYAHLCRFGKDVRVGAHVRQRQVIGFIGMTGQTTGPHLHFGLTRDGQYRNPLKEVFPRACIRDGQALDCFESKCEKMLSMLADP